MVSIWDYYSSGETQRTLSRQIKRYFRNSGRINFMIEKGIYEKLLSEPDVKVKGTVKELAAKYEIPVMTMVGFLDGIDESLIVPNPIEEMDEDTEET